MLVKIWDKEANEGKGDWIERRSIDAKEILKVDHEGKRYLAEKPEVEAKPKKADK